MQRASRAALVAGLTCFALALSDATAVATYPGANGRIAYVAADGSGIHTILPSGKGDQAIGVGGFPSWSADGQRIAFIRELHFNPDTGGNSEIFSMAADGSDVQRLTYRPGDDIAPFYSPNGRRIVFTGVQGIMTMRSDGSDLRLLTSTGGSYGWSPNGEWILYIVGRTGDTKPSIWEMRPDGSDKHRLVFLGSDGGYFSDYSPDGKRFIFVRWSYQSSRTFVARADGSNLHRLPCSPPFQGGTYSPNGQWLLGGVDRSFDPSNPGPYDLVRVRLSACRVGSVVSYDVTRGGPVFYGDSWQPLPNG